MMFPGAAASVYYNEEGEPIGWDYPDDDPRPDHDWFADDLDFGYEHGACEEQAGYEEDE